MLLNGRLIEDVEESDLDALIGVASESQTLDFKKHAYPTHSDQNGKATWDKAEFCADLSSFANAFGGWIICGMKESEGEVKEVCGLGSAIDVDREIGRLQQAANSGIEPRLPALKFQPVSLSDPQKSKALLIYVGRSFIGPHRVKETSKFHMRRSNGKGIEMNVDELRMAFNLSESLTERVKGFRKERVHILASTDIHEDIPVVLEKGPRLVVHSVPLSSVSLGIAVELNSLAFLAKVFPHFNMRDTFTNGAHHNFDGLILSRGLHTGIAKEYFQIYRNGVVEYVHVLPHNTKNEEKVISPFQIEKLTLTYLAVVLNMQSNLGIEPPLVIMLSLAGVRGYRYTFPNEIYYQKPESLNRDFLPIPEVVLTSYEPLLEVVMKSIFDVLWNSGGFNASPNYDENGNWIGGPAY